MLITIESAYKESPLMPALSERSRCNELMNANLLSNGCTQTQFPMINTLIAVLAIAQISEPPVTPAIPQIGVSSKPEIVERAIQPSASETSNIHQDGIPNINAPKHTWSDRILSFGSGVLVGWLGNLLRQKMDRKEAGRRLWNTFDVRFAEILEPVSKLSKPGEFAEIHASIVAGLRDSVIARLEWVIGKKRDKAQKAWHAFRQFSLDGCSDEPGYDPETMARRFENQKAETGQQRFERLVKALRQELK